MSAQELAMNNYVLYRQLVDSVEDEVLKSRYTTDAEYWLNKYLDYSKNDNSILIELGFVTQYP